MGKLLATFTLREKIILASIVILTILIPVTSFVIANKFRAQTTSQASNNFNRNISFSPSPGSGLGANDSPINELKKNSEEQAKTQHGSSPSPSPSDTIDVSFGPSLKFILRLEGRPADNQAVKLFVGIAAGGVKTNPQYLLTFSVPVPETGVYTGISLAGLNVGENYTAYLKGPGQIATASAFQVNPTVSDIGIVNLLSGDLNDDNVINAADYGIAKSLYGTTSSSKNWNPNADFNADGVVNTYDLGYILKNFGKTGAGSAWYSKVSSGSATLVTPPSQGGIASQSGHWMWIPSF